MRPLPELTPETEFFWTSGADGRLRFQYCASCERHLHPPGPVCPGCGGELEIRAVSGRATVVGFTVNHQPWLPEMTPPYVIALVAIDEDPLVRLPPLIIATQPDPVPVRLPVEVSRVPPQAGWRPVFAPPGRPGRGGPFSRRHPREVAVRGARRARGPTARGRRGARAGGRNPGSTCGGDPGPVARHASSTSARGG